MSPWLVIPAKAPNILRWPVNIFDVKATRLPRSGLLRLHAPACRAAEIELAPPQKPARTTARHESLASLNFPCRDRIEIKASRMRASPLPPCAASAIGQIAIRFPRIAYATASSIRHQQRAVRAGRPAAKELPAHGMPGADDVRCHRLSNGSKEIAGSDTGDLPPTFLSALRARHHHGQPDFRH